MGHGACVRLRPWYGPSHCGGPCRSCHGACCLANCYLLQACRWLRRGLQVSEGQRPCRAHSSSTGSERVPREEHEFLISPPWYVNNSSMAVQYPGVAVSISSVSSISRDDLEY